jgi:hypothetical protein
MVPLKCTPNVREKTFGVHSFILQQTLIIFSMAIIFLRVQLFYLIEEIA